MSNFLRKMDPTIYNNWVDLECIIYNKIGHIHACQGVGLGIGGKLGILVEEMLSWWD